MAERVRPKCDGIGWVSGLSIFSISVALRGIKRISAFVNGPLMEDLIRAAGHSDTRCPELFREGSLGCGRVVVNVCTHLFARGFSFRYPGLRGYR